jgi:predicted dehydrogenase
MSQKYPVQRIGLIGVGHRGLTLSKNVLKSGLGTIAAAYDAQPERANFLMKERNLPLPMVSRREDVLNNENIDAVIIATPDHCHIVDAIDAMRAGKPVLCEKPMATTIEDCDAMLRVQQETGTPLRVAFNLRHHPMYQAMHDIARSGDLGRITTVWVRHFVGEGGNFFFQDWHSLQKNVTSLLLQKATHDFDLIHFLSGSYTKRVCGIGHRTHFGGNKPNDLTCPACDERYTCQEANLDPKNLRNECAFRSEIDLEDDEMVMMELESGALANYSHCQFTPDYHRSYTVIGTKGRMEGFEYTHRRGSFQNEYRVEVLFRNDQPTRTYKFAHTIGEDHGGADPRIIKDWLLSVITGNHDAENPIAARQSVAVGCLGALSIRNGNDWRHLPPVPRKSNLGIPQHNGSAALVAAGA